MWGNASPVALAYMFGASAHILCVQNGRRYLHTKKWTAMQEMLRARVMHRDMKTGCLSVTSFWSNPRWAWRGAGGGAARGGGVGELAEGESEGGWGEGGGVAVERGLGLGWNLEEMPPLVMMAQVVGGGGRDS